MNGAEALVETMLASEVTVCFANPGTSEMQLVAALDKQPCTRAVLCLFEGVVTGAADGYGRMTDKPALTLLHLGPGLGNGTANLHNARRAHSPVLNMIGDHATYHRQYDAPLTSDIRGFAAPVSATVFLTTEASADMPCARRAPDPMSMDVTMNVPVGIAKMTAPVIPRTAVAEGEDTIANANNTTENTSSG